MFVSPVVNRISKGNKRFEKFIRILTFVFISFIIAAMLFSIGYLFILFMGFDWKRKEVAMRVDMKIRINQTKANFKSEFEIDFDDGTFYRAEASWLSRIFDCTLYDQNNHFILKTSYDVKINWRNKIPLKWLAGSPKLSRACNLIDAENEKGVFLLSTTGFLKSFYVIAYENMVLHGYVVAKGATKYIALYDAQKDKQVGLVVKPLDVDNNLDTYTLYLIDDVNCDPVVLSFFVVYYDNWNYGNQGEVVLHKREISREWSWSKYNKKYDSDWLPKNFPVFKWSDPPGSK